MLEKKKKYTYEELKEIIEKAHQKAIETLQKDVDETRKEKGKENHMASIAFMMQNMIVVQKIEEILFEEEKED